MSILDQLSISRKQARSIALANADASKSQINFWHGAVRSGKTIGSLVKFEMKLADAPEIGENLIISRTRDTAYRNIIAPMQSPALFGPWAEHVVYNRGAPTAEIMGEKVHIIGASDVRAEAVVRGMTVKRSYVDEWTLISEEFTNMLISRHSVNDAWCGGTSNPDAPQHYLKKDYIDRADERGHRIYHFNLEDNRAHLPEGYIENLSAQYTGMWHKRFIDGLWTMAQGAIYDSFDNDIHVVSELPEMRAILSCGIDYGTTNPTRGELIGLGVDDCLYVIAEWAPGPGTTGQRAQSLKRFLNETRWPNYLFIDPSAGEFKMQIYTDGGFPTSANGMNRVKDGIEMIASLLTAHRLFIHESCTELIGEMSGYVWDTKASEKGEDKPVKENDHAVDALRYGIATARPMWMDFIPLLAATKQPDDTLEVAA